MHQSDFTPSDLSRPLKRRSIISMVDSLDSQVALLKAQDAAAIENFDKICRELLYRGTGLEPGDLMGEPNGLRLMHPDEAVVNELTAMCIDLEVVNNERGIGWKITHALSGMVGTLFMPSPANGCNVPC